MLTSPDAREKLPIFHRDFGKAAGKWLVNKNQAIRYKDKLSSF
jgi:hypothetical protein